MQLPPEVPLYGGVLLAQPTGTGTWNRAPDHARRALIPESWARRSLVNIAARRYWTNSSPNERDLLSGEFMTFTQSAYFARGKRYCIGATGLILVDSPLTEGFIRCHTDTATIVDP